MKKHTFLAVATMALTLLSANAQTVNVPFSTKGAGKSLPVNWGMDAAWDWDYNVMRGIAHYGTNFTTGRISFQPYNLVDPLLINDASANFGLSAGQVRKLQWRIDLIKRTGATKVNINCDHEVLVRKMDDQGNYSDALGDDYVGKANYVSTDGTTYKTAEWVNLIKATVKYAQAQGMEVVSVSPFNESDYGWEQYYNGQGGTNTTNQDSYGIPTFKAIAQAIKEDSFFDGIRVCGGNTLNCDRASAWYEGLKPYVDEGNTHQLAGSFANYADFFKKVRDDGKVATADELHNVGEAMVGVEYGMQNGIWWGFDSKARGQFMHDSNEGVRLGYAEDRSHWTSAAVYRNDKDGEIHGFIGSSERQANVSIYNFQCQDREVYFNGYGPQREWSVTTVGGASGSYQNGQINYERFFDITFGEDVQSFPVDGNYQIMSAVDMKLVTNHGNPNDLTCEIQNNSNDQRWHVYPSYRDGDCSYWFIDNVGDADLHWNLRDGGGAPALEAGTRILCYNAGHDALEQFYLRYAKDGYFYIITRQSNKYLYNNNGSISVQAAPTPSTGANELKKYMWRLMPTDATAEQTAPATPANLAEGAVTAANVNISWDAVSEANVTYNILRQDANGWNTIARQQSATSFTDTNVEAGKGYRYKVQAVDYSGNRSEASEVITIMVPEEQGGETPTFTAGQWEWVGETVAAGNFYIKSVAHGTYLNTNNGMDVAANTLWTLTKSSNNWDIASNSKHISMTRSGSFWSYSYSCNTGAASGTVYLKSSTKTQNAYIIAGTYDNSRYLNQSNASAIVTNSTATSDATTTTWYFISENQMDKYALVSDYTDAFNTAKGYLSSELSDELMTELTTTLDACDGTINYTNIEGYITNLTTVAEKCRQYVQEHPAQPGDERTDFTGLIINPTINQSGTTNDAPTGWNGENTNVTGNGHWTEGTGDTRLEAWNWSTNANGLSADYYQEVIVPNGLYTLTAVTHQRANGDAHLYGETYRSFNTTMPVGDGNEAVTAVQNILVTDGCIRIGVRATNDYTGDNQWMTADNFTLTRVSIPAETALSHYTDAIAYLNGLAEVEFARNIDHAELLAAYNAANPCEANVSAYETAINNLYAAIKRSQAMVAAEPVLSASWIGQTGNYDDAAERYNWDNPYPAGRILYQVVEDLIPGAEYEIQFYAVANVARNLDAGLYSGSGITYLFANDTEQDINVIYQDGCTPANYLRTLRAVADENGQIAYGIANRKAGGQWYVAKAKSITLLGMSHSATLSVKPNKYGTFVAPFDVTLPEGITAYSVDVNGSSARLTIVAEAGEALPANTPVVVKNNTGSQIAEVYVGDMGNQVKIEGNNLVGFLMDGLVIPNNGNTYVLQTQNGEQAFYQVNGLFKGAANRCYLAPSAAQAALRLSIDVDNAFETGIIFAEEDGANAEYYAVDGTRLSAPIKGINIVRTGNKTKKIFVR